MSPCLTPFSENGDTPKDPTQAGAFRYLSIPTVQNNGFAKPQLISAAAATY